ncbi:MAG: hypothetical protein ABI036_06185 [Fibrobacteria bacterium]
MQRKIRPGFLSSLILALVSAPALALLAGCSTGESASPIGLPARPGSVSFRVAVDPASPFASIAKSGDISVSGSDMATLTAPLSIGATSVTGEVRGIPTGTLRSIRANVYDSAGTVRYSGSATVAIFPDSTLAVPLVLARITGAVTISGSISESDSGAATSTPLSPIVRVTVGAQASAVHGAVLDLDSKSVWLSAKANASQSDIDLVFLFYGNAFHLDNAVAAKAAGLANSINLVASYDVTLIQNIDLVKTAAMPADQESAKRIFTDGVKLQGSTIQPGDLLIVESTGGALHLVKVSSFTGTDKVGDAVLDISPLTIP